MTPPAGQKTYTDNQVTNAVNLAAEQVLELAGDRAEGMRDAVNLIVNAGLYYLDHPSAGIDEVIRDCYDDQSDEVITWITDQY